MNNLFYYNFSQIERWDRLNLKYTQCNIVNWAAHRFNLSFPLTEIIVEEIIHKQDE
jgi:hypothetical protein